MHALAKCWSSIVLLHALSACAGSPVTEVHEAHTADAVPSSDTPALDTQPARDAPTLASITGTYVRGGHGMWDDSLTIDAAGGMSRRYSSDGGAFTLAGTAQLSGTKVCILPTESHGNSSWSDPCFQIVPWGRRLYLVEASRMLQFCNAVNAGEEPRTGDLGSTLMREGGWKKGVDGKPEVSSEWRPFLLPAPVFGRVTADAGDRDLWISLGASSGMRAGMQLYLVNVPTGGKPARQDVAIDVISVEQDRSLARLVYGQRLEYAMQPGLRVSSRPAARGGAAGP
jgi:hypothetical protein